MVLREGNFGGKYRCSLMRQSESLEIFSRSNSPLTALISECVIRVSILESCLFLPLGAEIRYERARLSLKKFWAFPFNFLNFCIWEGKIQENTQSLFDFGGCSKSGGPAEDALGAKGCSKHSIQSCEAPVDGCLRGGTPERSLFGCCLRRSSEPGQFFSLFPRRRPTIILSSSLLPSHAPPLWCQGPWQQRSIELESEQAILAAAERRGFEAGEREEAKRQLRLQELGRNGHLAKGQKFEGLVDTTGADFGSGIVTGNMIKSLIGCQKLKKPEFIKTCYENKMGHDRSYKAPSKQMLTDSPPPKSWPSAQSLATPVTPSEVISPEVFPRPVKRHSRSFLPLFHLNPTQPKT